MVVRCHHENDKGHQQEGQQGKRDILATRQMGKGPQEMDGGEKFHDTQP